MKAKILKFLLPIFSTAIVSQAQNKEIDSLNVVLNAHTHDTIRVQVLNELGWSVLNLGNYGKAAHYATEAQKIGTELNYQKGIALSHNILGSVYYSQGKYPQAISEFLALLKISQENGFTKYTEYAYGNLGLVYTDQQNFPQADLNLRKSLSIAQKMGNKQEIASNLLNIGSSFYGRNEMDSAISLDKQALLILKEIGDKKGISTVCQNLGEISCDEAVSETRSDKKEKLLEEAMENYLQAFGIATETGDKERLGSSSSGIGRVYTLQNNFEEAQNYLEKSVALSKEIGDLRTLYGTYQNYFLLDSMRGDNEGALNYYKKFIEVKDSLTNEDNVRKQTQIEMNYEFDKKESSAKAEQEKKDSVTKIIIWSISGGLLLVLVLAIFIFRSYRQKQKANIIITQQKEEMERQKILVEEKQKEIIDSIYYAKRIQQSLLPTEKYIQKKLNELI